MNIKKKFREWVLGEEPDFCDNTKSFMKQSGTSWLYTISGIVTVIVLSGFFVGVNCY